MFDKLTKIRIFDAIKANRTNQEFFQLNMNRLRNTLFIMSTVTLPFQCFGFIFESFWRSSLMFQPKKHFTETCDVTNKEIIFAKNFQILQKRPKRLSCLTNYVIKSGWVKTRFCVSLQNVLETLCNALECPNVAHFEICCNVYYSQRRKIV